MDESPQPSDVAIASPLAGAEAVVMEAPPPSEKKPRVPYGSLSRNGASRRLGDTSAAARMRQTIRSGVCTFTVGLWPRGCGTIKRDGDDFKNMLTELVKERCEGIVTPAAAHLIRSACIHHIRGRLYQKYLKDADMEDSESPMNHMERAGYLDRIGQATDAVDNCLRRLGLDVGTEDIDEWGDYWKAKPARKGRKTG